MRVIKRDVEAVKMAIDIYETNEEAGNENPNNYRVLLDLKILLVKMEKSLAKASVKKSDTK